MGILILAANTSFADFPRLSSILAMDYFLPRQFKSLGDRLVYSNGIILLGVLSGALVLLFKAHTHALIPLYAVGVFLSFTFSQFGMVLHWLKNKKPGWKRSLLLNGSGAILTGMVTLIFTITKFIYGAWIIILLIPILIFIFKSIQKHYFWTGIQLSLDAIDPATYPPIVVSSRVIVPISGMHKGIVEALKYARSIASDVQAVYVELDPKATERLKENWKLWGDGAKLEILKSPYRSVLGPLVNYLEKIEKKEGELVTVVVPEFITSKLWEGLLHNQTSLLLKAALVFKKDLVVTTIRYHLD
jgi:hypothetical protein